MKTSRLLRTNPTGINSVLPTIRTLIRGRLSAELTQSSKAERLPFHQRVNAGMHFHVRSQRSYVVGDLRDEWLMRG